MKNIGYAYSTYWHDLYKKIQHDTHWDWKEMIENVPDICGHVEKERIDNIYKSSARAVGKYKLYKRNMIE